MKPIIRTLLAGAVVLAGAWYVQRGGDESAAPPQAEYTIPAARSAVEAATPPSARASSDSAVQHAFAEQARGRQLQVEGTVRRLLPDDRDGSPHQRFIIATDSDHSLLVAHNIDLAPRLDGLAVGDHVSVFGEYEWNPQGGVMHWTHDDPRGNHVTGYIEWRGRRYQ